MTTQTADFKNLVRRIRRLPPLSDTAHRLLALMRQDDYDMGEIVAVVVHDAALTANVLKVVNSPLFGVGHEVSSVERAVNLLGERMVVGIAIGSCSAQIYNHDLAGYESEPGMLWRHCLFVAIASRGAARYARSPGLRMDDVFTAGILHDIGKAVLSASMEGVAKRLIALVDTKLEKDYSAAERRLLATDHGEAGMVLGMHWRLPDNLLAAIRRHHEPAQAEASHRQLAYAVHLGDAIAQLHGVSTGVDALQYDIDPEYERYFDLNEERLHAIFLASSLEYERTRTLFFN